MLGSQSPFSLNPDYQRFLLCIVLITSLPRDSVMSFTSPKFREKCQRSCQNPGSLDAGSERVFAHFHRVQIILSRKKRHKAHYSMSFRVGCRLRFFSEKLRIFFVSGYKYHNFYTLSVTIFTPYCTLCTCSAQCAVCGSSLTKYFPK